MKDKTDKPVISYYLGNNYIIIWDEKNSVHAQSCTFVPDINKQALIFHREWPYHMKTYTVF
jgi:hypothetical protein